MSSHSQPPVSRSARTRLLLLAPIAALVLTSFEVHAAPLGRSSADSAQQLAPAGDSDFGARRRARRGNGAAGLAMMGMMVGTIGAVIAAQQRREAYEAAYNRSVYGYPHAYSQPYPHAYHVAPRAYHHYSRGYDGQPPTPPLINGQRVGW